MLHSLCVFAHLLSLASLSSAQPSLSLSVPPSASKAPVSSYVSPSFAGFGIEPSNLFSFTGNEKTNQFSVQLMQNLADFSGAPPHIRLGGNTQDYMIYDESYESYGWKKNDQSTAQGAIAADSMIIGPGYFKALERFPAGTPVTYGLNLAYSSADWADRIVKAAQAAVDGMKNVKLYSFEVGNEPDLWLQNQFRTAGWNGQVYTEQFLDRASVVCDRVLKPAKIGCTMFEAPATASTIGTTFEIKMLVQDGLLKGTNGVETYVSAWNQHDYFYFIGVTPTPITVADLLELDGTNRQFAYWEKQVNIGLDTGLPYVLREMSSVGPVGKDGISDTFAAALWTLNFFLYTAALDISSVQMHMTDNSNASAWQPRTMYGRDTFVRPQYYAHAAMAQIIGNGNGTTQIAALDTSNVGSDYKGHIRAYSMYSNQNLQSVVLVNAQQANASDSNKGSFTFQLSLGQENADRDVYLSLLTADGADSLTGTTWNGMTFSDDDGKMSVSGDSPASLRTSSSGSISIPVRDSQAVVANLGWLLGSTIVLTPNGTESPRPRKKNAAGPTSTSGASTAAWTGVLMTTLAIASSMSGGGDAEETDALRSKTGQSEEREV